jgi:hypothetical protein
MLLPLLTLMVTARQAATRMAATMMSTTTMMSAATETAIATRAKALATTSALGGPNVAKLDRGRERHNQVKLTAATRDRILSSLCVCGGAPETTPKKTSTLTLTPYYKSILGVITPSLSLLICAMSGPTAERLPVNFK